MPTPDEPPRALLVKTADAGAFSLDADVRAELRDVSCRHPVADLWEAFQVLPVATTRSPDCYRYLEPNPFGVMAIPRAYPCLAPLQLGECIEFVRATSLGSRSRRRRTTPAYPNYSRTPFTGPPLQSTSDTSF